MEENREKTYVKDIDRSVYDIRNDEKDAYRLQEGLTPAIVEQLSRKKRIRLGWSFFGFDLYRSTTA